MPLEPESVSVSSVTGVILNTVVFRPRAVLVISLLVAVVDCRVVIWRKYWQIVGFRTSTTAAASSATQTTARITAHLLT